jgi:hypothetical protein
MYFLTDVLTGSRSFKISNPYSGNITEIFGDFSAVSPDKTPRYDYLKIANDIFHRSFL